MEPAPLTDIAGARALAMLGDSITTDHISPAGNIKKDSPAGKYLVEHGVQPADFNSYGARRGNHEVMMRGTFANTRLKNQLAPGTEGGWTTLSARRRRDGDLRRRDAIQGGWRAAGHPGGQGIRSGSSRDWAAKGTALLGVQGGHRRELRAHSSQQPREHGRAAAAVRRRGARRIARHHGHEMFEIHGVTEGSARRAPSRAGQGATTIEFEALVRIDTPEELVAFRHGGILPYVFASCRKEVAVGELESWRVGDCEGWTVRERGGLTLQPH